MASKREVVVVTGASAGVGRAIVRSFARRGARLGLIARGVDRLHEAHRAWLVAGLAAVGVMSTALRARQ